MPGLFTFAIDLAFQIGHVVLRRFFSVGGHDSL